MVNIRKLVESKLFIESAADDLMAALTKHKDGEYQVQKLGFDIDSAKKLSDTEVEEIKSDLLSDHQSKSNNLDNNFYYFLVDSDGSYDHGASIEVIVDKNNCYNMSDQRWRYDKYPFGWLNREVSNTDVIYKVAKSKDIEDIRSKRADIKANLNKISSDTDYSFYSDDDRTSRYYYNGYQYTPSIIELEYNSDNNTWVGDKYSKYTGTQIDQFIKDNGFFRYNKSSGHYEPASDRYVKMAKSNPSYKVYTKVPSIMSKVSPSQVVPLPSEEKQIEINNTLRDKMIALRDKTIEDAKDKYRKLSKELEDRVLNGETSGNWEKYERPIEHIKELISRLRNTKGANDMGGLIPEQDEIKYRNSKDAMEAWKKFKHGIDYELGYINFGDK